MNDVRSERHVKVLLDIERDDGTHEVESVWALGEEGGYRLDNIPFYARGFALGDVVSAAVDAAGLLRCTGLVTPSGHSTIRLWFADAKDVQKVRDELRAMGCSSELDLPRLVAVDVPPQIPYRRIQKYLDDKERASVFEYQEACLGQSES
jgi:hypothetical protein